MSTSPRGNRLDTADALHQDSLVLMEARAILTDRFSTGKFDEVAVEVRKAAIELVSRSRHPSRQPQGPIGVVTSEPQD